jgi:hypothetical protein
MTHQERAQFINNWAQSIAIIIVGLWVLGYTFFYSDIYKSSIKPTHVTPTIKVKAGKPANGYIPVSVRMEIENESKRDVHILPAIFLAVGNQIKPIDGDHQEYLKFISDIANEDHDHFQNRYFETKNKLVVAGGGVFSGLLLSPNENITKTIVFYVPENKFQSVEVTFNFWAHKGVKELWSKISFPNDKEFHNTPCIVINQEPWECAPLPTGEAGKKELKKLDLWEFESMEQIPLPFTEGG